jgi:chemotaxis protein MotB
MGRYKKQAEPDETPGAPEWMVTFSDCMTLLLTFFVLLLTFSSFDNRIFRRLKVIYSAALTNITPSRRSDRDALIYFPPVRHISDLDEGSEKTTLTYGDRDGVIKESIPLHFNNGIIFILPSNSVFWGNGTVISTDGRHTMDKLALFLSGTSNRIVISENGPSKGPTGESLGLERAWTVMKYLIDKHNLDKKRFSISSVSTLSQQSNQSSYPDSVKTTNGRAVEIVLLTRNIYN